MKQTVYIEVYTTDPTFNLALEEYVFEQMPRDKDYFLTWQNDNAIIVGRHQNTQAEINEEIVAKKGIRVVRRLSGGGAVYHDLGNLCYTFIMSSGLYDKERQLNVILQALQNMGIDAQFTGRNDISLSDGRKFSGNAFRFVRDKGLMLGTLLVNTDFNKMSKYLSVSKAKIAAKGVDSVRSRTVNLSSVNPDITVENLTEQLKKSFLKEYGYCKIFTEYDIIEDDSSGDLHNIEKRYASWDWRLGLTPVFDASFEKRFTWGGIELHLNIRAGTIESLRVFTDSMEPDLGVLIENVLLKLKISKDNLIMSVNNITEALPLDSLIDKKELAADLLAWFDEIF
jgi:lipoate-protein ligase A